MLSIVVALSLSLTTSTGETRPGETRQARDTRTWYQAYSDAQRAIQQSRWQVAIDSLEFARRIGPKPGRRVPSYGDRFEDFLPDYFLGIAYLGDKRYAEADRAFAAVRASNLIGPRDREFATFDSQSKRASFELLMVSAQTALDEKRFDDAQRLAGAATSVGVDTVRSEALSGRIRNAQQAAAVAATATANPPVASPPPVAAPPVAATADPNRTAAGTTPAPNPGAVATAPVGNPTPAGPAPAAIPPRSAAAATPLARRQEEDAVRAFLSGQYTAASQQLSAASANPGASSRVYFYLACAEVARVLTGETPGASVSNARAALVRAGDVNQFAADRRFISPRILKVLGLTP